MNLKAFVENMKSKYDLEDLYLYETRGTLRLDTVRVKKENRKKGVGTAFMEDLIKFADDYDMTITLTPATSEYDGTTSKSRLEKFYKRFGFVNNKGRNKDYRISDSMIHRPMTTESKMKKFKDIRNNV